jgi:sulfide dehydrogenase cytochrome subunit
MRCIMRRIGGFASARICDAMRNLCPLAAVPCRRGHVPLATIVRRSQPMRPRQCALSWFLVIGAALCAAAPAAAADIEKLVAVCSDCHGKQGASTEHDIPIIGGYSSDFLVNNIKAYQKKDRDCPETKIRAGSKKGNKTTMCQVTKDFTGAEIRQIADYFAQQKFVPARQPFDAALAARGRKVHDQYCEKCHTDGGTHSDDEAGMPAGQWVAYLEQAVDEFKTGKRPIPKKMKDKLDQVDADGVKALIQFYASIQDPR